MVYHVYILASGNGVLYVGVTNHLERRVRQHRRADSAPPASSPDSSITSGGEQPEQRTPVAAAQRESCENAEARSHAEQQAADEAANEASAQPADDAFRSWGQASSTAVADRCISLRFANTRGRSW